VPPNVTATVKVPVQAGQTVTVDGKSAASSPGVDVAGITKGRANFRIGAGTYRFVAE
jgi:hypothetical protein